MPGFHHSVAFLPLPFRKIPLFCKNYVTKFRSVTAVNSKKIHNGSGKGLQRLTGTAKRQRKNGNGVVEIGHYAASCLLDLSVWSDIHRSLYRGPVAKPEKNITGRGGEGGTELFLVDDEWP